MGSKGRRHGRGSRGKGTVLRLGFPRCRWRSWSQSHALWVSNHCPSLMERGEYQQRTPRGKGEGGSIVQVERPGGTGMARTGPGEILAEGSPRGRALGKRGRDSGRASPMVSFSACYQELTDSQGSQRLEEETRLTPGASHEQWSRVQPQRNPQKVRPQGRGRLLGPH